MATARMMKRKPQQMLLGLAVLCSAFSLAGCVETMQASAPAAAVQPQHSNMARNPGVSPRGASVALASISGAPEAIAERFNQTFAQEAATREISLAEPKTANYLVRGYISASPAEKGTSITYVWDVFDSKKNRAQRVSNFVMIPATAPDPWSVVDDKALASLAARSADDLAAVLTNTPEAIANNGKAPAPAVAAASPTPSPAKTAALTPETSIVRQSVAAVEPTSSKPTRVGLATTQ